MCVIIYGEKEMNSLMETGLDLFVPVIKEGGDEQFFRTIAVRVNYILYAPPASS